MRKLLPIFLCANLILPGILSGQDYIVNAQFYGTDQGLSHRDVQAVHQDKQGFIWLGTNYGLNRFDGYNFKWYTKEKHGLQSNTINHIAEDEEGWMWLFFTTNWLFQTPVSIDLFNPLTEEVLSFEEKFGTDLPFDFKDISSFTASETGQIAFVTNKNKFILYSAEKGFEVSDLEISPITLSCFSKHNTVWGNLTLRDSFYRDTKKEIDFGIDSLFKDVIVEIDLTGKLVNRYEHKYLFQYNLIGGVDQSDNLWYMLKHAENNRFRGAGFNKGKIIKIDVEGKETEFSLNQATASSDSVDLDISALKAARFWVNPYQKSFWFDSYKHFLIFHPESGWYQELSSDYKGVLYPNTIYFDNNDRVWVGTEFGINVIKLNPNPFRKIGQLKTETDFQPFRGITEDVQNNFWACTDRGAPLLLHIKSNDNQYEAEFDLNEWSFGFRYGIFTDKNGFLWFGTGEFGHITKYDLKTGIPQFFPYSGSGKRANHRVNVWSFHQDKKDRIWFGTDVGQVGYINDNQSVIMPFELEGVQNQGGCIYQFLEDKKGTTWVATDKGLFILDTENEKISPYPANEISEDLPFLEAGIFHIYENSDGSFWMGTRGMGLIHWYPSAPPAPKGEHPPANLETESAGGGSPLGAGGAGWQQYTKADGLSDNTIYAVYEDDFENLWMTSDYGIIQFNKKTHRTKAYLEKDGITHNEFNRISHYKSKDGTLLFGGLNGITAFHPKDLVGDSTRADIPLVLTEFQHFDGSQNQLIDKTSELQKSKTITLAPDDRFFRLEFALLTFLDSENVQYGYKVEGVDKDWTYQKENSVRFSRLPYGEHILRIKGQASDGQWSNNELAIKVLVLKPFYLKTWFLFALIFGTLIGVYVFYNWRVSNLKKRQKELKKTVAERTKELVEDKKIIEQQSEELRQLDKVKSRFFANVSHELRTPLTLMLGPISSAIKTGELNNRTFTWLKTAQQNGRHLLKLVNEILDLSKLDSDKLELTETSVNLFKFIRRIISNFESHAERLGLELSFEYKPEQSLKLKLDERKVETILNNLLSNALKFTPKGGQVKLSVSDLSNRILIKVEDSGRGIHPEDLPKIFDRFYQSNQPDSAAEGGTGIGLALSRELVDRMKGKLWAESSLDKGSTFSFEFPRKEVFGMTKENLQLTDSVEEVIENNFVKTDSDLPVSGGENRKTLPAQNLPKILLVEDNPTLSGYIQSILEHSYEVHLAENGKEALRVMNDSGSTPSSSLIAHHLSLIISDIMMPVMDGYQLLEKLKSDDLYRHIPVIMLTARADIQDKLKALRIGVDDYMLKPFDEEELLVRIETLLKNYDERKIYARLSKNEESVESTKSKPEITIRPEDQLWLKSLENTVLRRLSEPNLTMEELAQDLAVSRRNFYRRVKQLTGLTPKEYLREVRLQQARSLLENRTETSVKAAAGAVGFIDPKYFSRIFRQRFLKLPSELL